MPGRSEGEGGSRARCGRCKGRTLPDGWWMIPGALFGVLTFAGIGYLLAWLF